MIKSIEEADIVAGTIVLVRADWNVPVKEDRVLDSSRIEATLKTINFILDKGGKAVILSHLGDGADSLAPAIEEAQRLLPNTFVKFVRDPWNNSSPDGRKILEGLKNGEVAVFENLRFWAEKENDKDFAEKLSEFGDIYVNEAFPVSHRDHTSIVLLPKLLPAYAGFRFLEEYNKLSEVFSPEHPFLFILGGAKFETKLPLVEKFLKIADYLFIGGALAAKALQMGIACDDKIILPLGDMSALDANDQTLKMLGQKIKEAKFVLWNGPLGKFEDGYGEGTRGLGKLLSDAEAYVILGGGDTLAAIDHADKDKISSHGFVSTAGGAMLDFLGNGTLPGIEALK